jgi:methyl-accepting chemotaxis protein
MYAFGERYKGLLWWTMDVVGVTQSVKWKVLIAVGIQFAVSLAQMGVPLVLSGWLRVWVAVFLFVLAGVAFLNTVLIVRNDIINPIIDLEDASRRIARGDLDVEVSSTDQKDEIGSLSRSFDNMRSHLDVVAEQAEALADQRFDAPILDNDLPGRFGDALGAMTDNLTEYVEQIETDRNRFRLLNDLVGHDVPNVVNIIYGRLDLLREACDDEERLADIDVLEDQAREIEDISNAVTGLTSATSVRQVDVGDRLTQVVDRLQNSFHGATVSLELPDERVYIRGNDLLDRVFENLIVNGIEHNDADEPRVTVEVTGEDGCLNVVISDNGSGLDVDDPDDLFESVEEGTGLDIVRTIVTSFGGEIHPVDRPTQGATFVVRFPRADQAVDEQDTARDWFETPSVATPQR